MLGLLWSRAAVLGGGLQEVLGGLAQGSSSEAGPVLLEALVVGGNCHELERGGV